MAYFIFVFSVISDWFSCFSFTEGVRRLLLLIFKDELPLRTCLDFVIEFCNRLGKPKCNQCSVLTIFTSQFSPYFINLFVIVFIQFNPAMFIPVNP